MREAKIVRLYKNLLSEKNDKIRDLEQEVEDLEYIQDCLVEELEDILGKKINTNNYLRYR